MYFPILRGRQFELIALRELSEKKIISDNIIPVIEPVKATSSVVKTLHEYINKDRKIAIICNPIVGTWEKEIKLKKNEKLVEEYNKSFVTKNVIKAWYLNETLMDDLENQDITTLDDSFLICKDNGSFKYYSSVVQKYGRPHLVFIPDKSEYRRIVQPSNLRVVCEDQFNRQERNVDYLKNTDEYFSSYPKYYQDDGYVGFSDYSIIGDEYSESGFAPFAVAIHIVYFDEDEDLRIEHFVSDSNEDIYNPAGKYSEALVKIDNWVKTKYSGDLTVGLNGLLEDLKNEKYSGLGVIKKYSIMHHLELVGKYLNK